MEEKPKSSLEARGKPLVEVRMTMESILVVAAILLGTTGALAGPNESAKVLIHRGPPPPTVIDGICTSQTAIPGCGIIVTSGTLYPPTAYPYVYLLVGKGNATEGVGSVECGLSYNPAMNSGVRIFSWNLCASGEAPVAGANGPWPSAGAGNRITWDPATRCQRYEPEGSGTGVVTIAGYFYVAAYSPDTLAVTTNPGTGHVAVGDCSAIIDNIEGRTPSHLGYVVFSPNGDVPGYNPCLMTIPVRGQTWSRIKTIPAE